MVLLWGLTEFVYVKHLEEKWAHSKCYMSILKNINPEYSLEGPILKLKLQHFGHLMQRADSLEKTLILGKIAGKRRRGQQRIRWLDNISDSVDMNLSKLWEIVKEGQGSLACCSSWGQTWLSDWTITTSVIYAFDT